MMQPQAVSARLKIEFAQRSDPGRDPNKQINEDSCGYHETRHGQLGVLCDGMGGHYGGREASQLAIKTIFEVFEQAPPHVTPSAALKGAVEEAGRRVYLLGGPPENRTRPGSTCVAILLHDRGADVAHVGDSRAYVIRAWQIYPLTRDHSMVQGMIDAGLLTEEQAIGHPDGNKITRALGMKPEVEVEVRPEPMELFPGDIFVLASDGLTDLARPNEILGATKQALASGSLESACAALVVMANERGGHDNITVQMARVLDVAPKVSMTIPQAPSALAGGDPGSPGAAKPQGGAGPIPLHQTIQMTQPETKPGITPAQASPMPAAPASPSPQGGGAWGAVAPTAVGTPAPPTYNGNGGAKPGGVAPTPTGPSPTITSAPSSTLQGASPTVVEAAPVSEAWHSQRFSEPPPGLAPYRIDVGVGGLQLPPPRPGSAPHAPGARGAHPTLQQDPASLRYGASGAPSGPYSVPPGARPAKGGIVFVIIGLSAVIAVLLVIILWIVLNR